MSHGCYKMAAMRLFLQVYGHQTTGMSLGEKNYSLLNIARIISDFFVQTMRTAELQELHFFIC